VPQLPESKLGWMEPVFYGYVDGEPLGVFTPEQMEKIQSGYGCPRCWQEFTIVFTRCPVCDLDLEKHGFVDSVKPMPDEWKPGPDDDRIMEPLKRSRAKT